MENSTDKAAGLAELRQEISVCQKCSLCKTRTNTVPGEGGSNAEILFIGEAPGANEDKNGIPFCGAAGKFLDEMLGTIGLSRENVFVANTLKCRPPENRDPEDSERVACRPYLDAQLKIIEPALIILMGRHAVANFLPGAGTIGQLHGRALKRPNGIVYLPLYHPAAALHNGGLRSTLVEDFGKIPAVLKKIQETKEPEEKEEPPQQKLI